MYVCVCPGPCSHIHPQVLCDLAHSEQLGKLKRRHLKQKPRDLALAWPLTSCVILVGLCFCLNQNSLWSSFSSFQVSLVPGQSAFPSWKLNLVGSGEVSYDKWVYSNEG